MTRSQTGHRRNGESGLVQRVRARLAALPIAGVPVIVVGVSGGIDSLALAGVLAELDRQKAVRVVAVHVDHRLRPASVAEQDHVAGQVRALGIEFLAERLTPGVRARHPGVGLEEAARRERFAALARVARLRQADAIALGHHALDQAETVLLHLIRGTGLHGMSGMAEWSVRPIPWWDEAHADETVESFSIWRPFLSELRAELELYVEALSMVPIFDPSNTSFEYKRNRIRHELLPLIEEISPGATAGLVRYSQLAAAEDSYLDSVAAALVAAHVDDHGRLEVRDISGIDVVLQRRAIRLWLQSVFPAGLDIAQERVEAVRALGLTGQGGSRIQIGAGWQVVRTGGHLRTERELE